MSEGRGIFRHRFAVRFADVDHAGIVYYPLYYHYFHIAFEELFRVRMGAESYLQLLDVERIGFPAVRAECDYRSPLRFGDLAETEVALERLGNKSVTLRYRVHKVSGVRTLAAEGLVVCAVIDLDAFRAVAIPEELRRLFLELAEDGG